MKKGRLTKVEKSYIEHSKDSIAEIAAELDRSEKTVEKYWQEFIVKDNEDKQGSSPPQEDKESKPDDWSPLDDTVMGQSFGRPIDAATGKHQKGIVVQTGASSSMADDVPKRSNKTRLKGTFTTAKKKKE